jgi:hypothetical protein
MGGDELGDVEDPFAEVCSIEASQQLQCNTIVHSMLPPQQQLGSNTNTDNSSSYSNLWVCTHNRAR